MIIAHVSDLHLNSIFKSENELKIKKLLFHLREIDIDHLVVTGDISDNADAESFESFKSILQETGFFMEGSAIPLILCA